jgi:hypothetical protein
MPTFAVTVPATPLNNCVPRRDFVIYVVMRYTKQPIDIPAQLAILKQRGLVVSDETLAKQQLASISYFRLAQSDSASKLLCTSWPCLESSLSNNASVTSKTTACMGGYTACETHETLCPTMYIVVYRTEYYTE